VGDLRQRPERQPGIKLERNDLLAIGLFAIAGAIIGLDFAIVYIGINFLNVIGVEWHWIWERSVWR